MPFCTNCGRKLEDNEVCNCSSQQAAPPPVNTTPPSQEQNQAPQPNVHPGFQQYDQYGRPLYDQYGRPLFTPQGLPITYDENGHPIVNGQKKSGTSGCLIATIIVLIVLFVFLVIGGILAAILVPAMLGFVTKSKNAAANSNASLVCHAANSALCDLDEECLLEHKGYTIISNSEKMPDFSMTYEYSGKPIDSDLLNTYMDNYADLENFEWFVVIHDGVAEYAAAHLTNNNKYIGTYPRTSNIDGDTPTYSGTVFHKCECIEDLYEDAVAEIKSYNFEYSFSE